MWLVCSYVGSLLGKGGYVGRLLGKRGRLSWAKVQLQVQRLDAARRPLRDEVDGDMRTVGEQAFKIKVSVCVSGGDGEAARV